MKTKVSRPQVLLSRRRLLNHTSPMSSAPQPHILTQDALNYIVCDLELSKSKADLLGSRLKQWNLLEKNVHISSFRSHHQHLVPFFRKEVDLVFCYNIDGLMNALGIKHDLQEWRLFIDSSKLSLKAVLLHNGNQHPSVPVGHCLHERNTRKPFFFFSIIY